MEAITEHREPPEYLTLVRPRCPECNSPNFRAYRTNDNGDGSKTRYSICQECGRRVVIIVE
jgi:transposase-like protein